MNAEDWTPQEEDYWRDLVAKQRTQEDSIVRRVKMEEDHLREMARIACARDKQIGGDHYKDMGVEPWDVVDTWPIEQRIGAYRHGALKYLMRCGSKDEQLQEIKKCGHYIEKLIEVLESA
jgi:hypothetical protein